MNKMTKNRGMDKKYKILLIISLVVAIILCIVVLIVNYEKNDEEPSLKEIVSSKIDAYETDFNDSLDSFQSNEDVAEYFVNWGKNKSIKVETDKKNNVIYKFKDTVGHEYKEPVALICEYDYRRLELYKDQIITCLTIAKNAKEHGTYQIIFTPVENGERVGIDSNFSKHLRKRPQIFYLGNSLDESISTTTSGYNEIKLSGNLEYRKAKYDIAYRVYIKNIPVKEAWIPDVEINPIKILGNVLATFKSTLLNFELASFKGGEGGSITPGSGEVTILVNSVDEEKFEEKMDYYIEKFYDKYGDDYPDIEYAYERVENPKKVLKKTYVENIISLMYTAPSGIYYRDDNGNVVALTTIKELMTEDETLTIYTDIYSYDDIYMEEILDSYEVIAGLSGVHCENTQKKEKYSGNNKSVESARQLERAYEKYTDGKTIPVGSTSSYIPVEKMVKDWKNASIVYCGESEKGKKNYAGAFIVFLGELDNQVSEEISF